MGHARSLLIIVLAFPFLSSSPPFFLVHPKKKKNLPYYFPFFFVTSFCTNLFCFTIDHASGHYHDSSAYANHLDLLKSAEGSV